MTTVIECTDRADERLSLPTGWCWSTLGESVVSCKNGLSRRPKGNEQGPIVLRLADVSNGRIDLTHPRRISLSPRELLDYDLRTGDVLFVRVNGSADIVGRCVLVEDAGGGVAFNDHLIRVRLREGLNPRYLSLFSHTNTARDHIAEKASSSAGQLTVNQDALASMPVPLPPLAEQRRIVAALDAALARLDTVAARLARVPVLLKRYRAAVLAAAVSGRLTEDWRAEHEVEPASALLQRVLVERRARWQAEQRAKHAKSGKPPPSGWQSKYQQPQAPDTEGLPELPEGWEWTSWAQLADRVTVGHVGPMKHEYVDDGVPFLRSQNVRENRFDPAGLVYINRRFHSELSKSVVRAGDLAVVRSGNVGITCVIPPNVTEANCSDLVLIQHPNGIEAKYGSFYMNSMARNAILAGQVGSALIHFNTKSVAELLVPLPPLEEQREIVRRVERLLAFAEAVEVRVERATAAVARTRQALLAKAFRGELVPQDPADEPASALLARLRASGGAQQARARRGRYTVEVQEQPQ